MDGSGLLNILHLARMILLLVFYVFSLDFLKNVIFFQGQLAENKYLTQRNIFFRNLRFFMRANLKFSIVLVIIIFAETCLTLTPPIVDFFINDMGACIH